MQNSATKLGAAIKAARKEKHLTQMELSETLGITPRHLQAIENENKTPSYDLLCRIFSYLNISADGILSDGDNSLTTTQEQLIFLIQYRCNEKDVSVLLATAKALLESRES